MKMNDFNQLVSWAIWQIIAMMLRRSTSNKNSCFLLVLDTSHENFKMSQRLRKCYTQEMVLVLSSNDTKFLRHGDILTVNINFSGQIEEISIPLEAIRMFIDRNIGVEIALDALSVSSIEGLFESIGADEGEIKALMAMGQKENNTTSDNLIKFSDLLKKK
jgi:hypothetical protein